MMLFVFEVLQELLQVVDHVVVPVVARRFLLRTVVLRPDELGNVLDDLVLGHFPLGVGAVLLHLAALHPTPRADDGVVLSVAALLLDVRLISF